MITFIRNLVTIHLIFSGLNSFFFLGPAAALGMGGILAGLLFFTIPISFFGVFYWLRYKKNTPLRAVPNFNLGCLAAAFILSCIQVSTFIYAFIIGEATLLPLIIGVVFFSGPITSCIFLLHRSIKLSSCKLIIDAALEQIRAGEPISKTCPFCNKILKVEKINRSYTNEPDGKLIKCPCGECTTSYFESTNA